MTDQGGQHLANALQALSRNPTEKARSGHPGLPMPMADVATAFRCDPLVVDPTDPTWPEGRS